MLVSCSASATPEPAPQPLPTPSATPEDIFQVVAWMDNPEPEHNERVILSGSLIKNGVYLGGMAMHAMWPDGTQERGVPNCSVQVIYQRGVCTIDASKYPVDVYVPITITFEYRDQIYIGHTGFTPR
jgi:hypothetical protein